MEGRRLLQYIIDTSDVVLAKKQEATEYLAKLERRPTKRAPDARKSALKNVSSNKKGSAKPACG